MIAKKILFVLASFMILTTKAYSLEHHVLDNGMEVFLIENHVVPLVHIRLTLRAGSIVETPELNGLCHLYEHMLFKGNKLYTSQEQLMAAIKRMGVGSWNGGTSTEYTTYFFTIPSDKTDDGLKFWAYAVKSPLLDQEEFIREKEVVYQEIAGVQSKPAYPLQQAIRTALFPEHHYRRDVGGELAVIKNATIEQMKHIRDNFYVPNNATLFVAGDIDTKEVLELVKKHYGDWEKGPAFPELNPHNPLDRDKWVTVATSPSQGIVNVSIYFRGPDTARDTEATYGADMWSQLVEDPEGKFKNNIYCKVPELHGETRNISAGYITQRDGGLSYFSFAVVVDDETDLLETIQRLRNAVQNEISLMLKKDYFSADSIQSVKTEISNQDILSRETPEKLASNLSFWWASTSTDYYLNYLDRIKKTSLEDVQKYIKTYLRGQYSVTSVWINSRDNEKHGLIEKIEELNR